MGTVQPASWCGHLRPEVSSRRGPASTYARTKLTGNQSVSLFCNTAVATPTSSGNHDTSSHVIGWLTGDAVKFRIKDTVAKLLKIEMFTRDNSMVYRHFRISIRPKRYNVSWWNKLKMTCWWGIPNYAPAKDTNSQRSTPQNLPSISAISVWRTKTSIHAVARHVYTHLTPTSMSAAMYKTQKRRYNIIPNRVWSRPQLFWLRNTRTEALPNAWTGSHSTPAMWGHLIEFATRGPFITPSIRMYSSQGFRVWKKGPDWIRGELWKRGNLTHCHPGYLVAFYTNLWAMPRWWIFQTFYVELSILE